MIELALGMLVLGADAGAWVAVRGRSGAQTRLEDELRRLALAMKGRLVRDREFGPPLLELDSAHGPGHARYLLAVADGERERMELELPVPRALPRLTVGPGVLSAAATFVVHDAGVELGDPGFERRFTVRAPDHAAARAALPASARAALVTLVDSLDGTLELELAPRVDSGTSLLTLRLSCHLTEHHTLSPALDRAAALVDALVMAWERPWQALEDRHGLVRADPLQPGRVALEGEVGGHRLRLDEVLRDGGLRTELWLSAALPFELEVVERGLADAEGWAPLRSTMGNPVLDMLVAVRCEDLERCRALLADDVLTGALLAVVHGRPGSRVTERGVDLVESGYPAEGLDAALDDALALADAIVAGVARLEGGS